MLFGPIRAIKTIVKYISEKITYVYKKQLKYTGRKFHKGMPSKTEKVFTGW